MCCCCRCRVGRARRRGRTVQQDRSARLHQAGPTRGGDVQRLLCDQHHPRKYSKVRVGM